MTVIWKPMLAASEIPKSEALSFPLMASFKLDGIRSPIIEGKAMSRKLLPLPNASYQEWVHEHQQWLEGIDCEVISGPPTGEGVFHRTQSAIMSASGTPDFKIYVFDAFHVGSNLPAHIRYTALQSWFKELPHEVRDHVVLLEQRLLQSIAELKAHMAEAMDAGFEGLILKHPQKAYKNGRSTVKEGTLMKWKEFADDEAVVLAVKQGKTNTNPKVRDALGHAKRSTAKAGMVLSDLCGGFTVSSKKFGIFDVGMGNVTEAESKLIWIERDKWIGKTIVFKYQPYGVIGLPRFPGFQKLLADNNLPAPD